MSDHPLISIALCTYNGERFLQQQLDSLLAQDYPRLEIIAVDDASADGTARILLDLAARDGRVKVYVNPSNLGFARNFERALTLCAGDWIAPCDQDDLWHPEKLSRLMNSRGQNDLVYCDSELVDESGRSLGQRVSGRFHFYAGADPRAFTFINCISGHAMLFSRELLRRALPLPASVYHDWWLAFVAANGRGIGCLPEPLVKFRQHGGNASDFTGQQVRKKEPTALQKFQRETLSLQALASFNGTHQRFFQQVAERWQRRQGHLFGWALAWLLFKSRHAVFVIRKTPPALRFKHIFKLCRGLRAGGSA